MSEDRPLRTALADSRLGRVLSPDTDVDPAGGSVLLDIWNRLTGRVDRAVDHSVVTRVTRRLARVARDSFCYRWLTTEPAPDVVVIDLRETMTVGPLIAGLDRLASWVGPRWRASGAYRAVDWLSTTFGPAADNASVTDALGSVLTPPEGDSGARTTPSASDDD